MLNSCSIFELNYLNQEIEILDKTVFPFCPVAFGGFHPVPCVTFVPCLEEATEMPPNYFNGNSLGQDIGFA